MCPVQWRRRSAKPLGPTFLRFPPNRLCVILEPPERYAEIALHWCEGKGESFPCMGAGECLLCPSSRKLHVYTGVVYFDYARRIWLRAIVDLGHPDSMLATSNLVGRPIVIGRERQGDRRSNLKLVGPSKEQVDMAPELKLPWDCRPHLMRRWGLFDEADSIQREPYYEQARLAFETSTKKEGD